MLKRISSRLILSYLIIILITSAFVWVIFSLSTSRYMENKVKKNLEGDLSKIKQAINYNFNVERENEQGRIRRLPRFRFKVDLGAAEDWAIVDKDLRVFYPRGGDEAEKFNAKILPAIKDKAKKVDSHPVRFQLDGIDYMAISSPVKLKDPPGFNGWIIAYTYIGTANTLRKEIFIVLLVTLIFAALIAILFGVFSAKYISKPIVILRNRAEMLSKRDFDTKVDIKTGDELEELADSMNKVADELKEYDIAQRKFIQNASHELKTPLMSIQGYAEGIKDGVFDDTEKALDIIVEESTRLKGLVEDIIYLSKLETLEDYYSFCTVSVNEIVGRSIEKINGLVIKEGISINLELHRDVQINADGDKLIQAMINIIGNCLRYTRDEIKIAACDDGSRLQIKISDNGDGFGENETMHIFERFFKGKKGKTGLGLAITKVIIEKHGGTIEACNGTNGGAEFTIWLPVVG